MPARTPRPYLILDSYLDQDGAAGNLLPLVAPRRCEIVRTAREPSPARAADFAGILMTGSAASVLDPLPWIEPMLRLVRDAAAHDVPVLGICFGHQAIARALFGPAAVRPSPQSEIGWAEIELVGSNPLVEGFEQRFRCFVSHFDEVVPGIGGLEVFARTPRCAVQGFQVRGRRMWAVQFHPEMPLEEARTLVRCSLARHAYLGEDPEPVLAGAVDSLDLGRRLAARFLHLVERPAGAPAAGSTTN